MNCFTKHIAGAALLVAMMTYSAGAVDQAAAAGNLAKINELSVKAKANLTAAAATGNAAKTADMNAIADAVDTALAKGQEAHAAMEKAVEAGDEKAAQAAADKVAACLAMAIDASNGKISNELAEAVRMMKNAGGTANPYDPPNMREVPWESDAQSGIYQAHWGNLFAAGRDSNDGEATPE